MKTFRIPKGLWDDLEQTVIHQDRSFLTDVARSLGLPVQDVLRKCLGTGANQAIPVLWMTETETEERCPWWDMHGDLWRPCCRPRLSPTLPCYKHERTKTSDAAKMHSDPYLQQLPLRFPVRKDGTLYWCSETDPTPLAEDGTPVSEWTCRIVVHNGSRIAIWKKT